MASGWEYTTDGKCEKMPSTRLLDVRIRSLPCFEQEGMIWIWPGDDAPDAILPSLLPPSGFVVHAEVYIISLFICFMKHTVDIWNLLEKTDLAYFVYPMPQIVMELPVEHGLLLDNLLDLAHAPFTHTSTFAKGWSVPRFVSAKLSAIERFRRLKHGCLFIN